MKESVNQSILQASLQVSGPRRELLIASLGCLMGTSLLLLGIQFYQDADAYLEQSQSPKNYFTLNKKVSGGALVNLGKNDQNFGPDELLEIRQTEGVRRLGGFSRNQFPVTVYIWPTGTVGLGAAAKADLFFESIPDEFLDFIPPDWKWEENASFVPIMVPKFYLDLWNFGLAPSRVEYPSLSTKAASGMPIEIFIGKSREATLEGRFVAFSKRINSVLVPESFLRWANQKYGQPDAGKFFFLWEEGTISGPPISPSALSALRNEAKFTEWEVSPLDQPANRIPAAEALAEPVASDGPSRIILEVVDNPSPALHALIEEMGYEMNREFPEQDLIKKALNGLFLGMVGIGLIISILSISTFASSFRLVVGRASEPTRNLILLGFSKDQISRVFFHRFIRLFSTTLLGAVLVSWASKYYLAEKAKDLGFESESGLSAISLACLAVYAALYLILNKRVIEKSVGELVNQPSSPIRHP